MHSYCMAYRRAHLRGTAVDSVREPSRDDGNTSSGRYLTLSEAARLAPGRPSASATWRWCRKGLRARDGSSVHLKHVRVGRMVYTTAQWLHEFFEAVAVADQKHFEGRNVNEGGTVSPAPTFHQPRSADHALATRGSKTPQTEDLEAALREEGL